VETSHVAAERRLLDEVFDAVPHAVVLEAGCGRTTRLAAYRDHIDRLVGVDLDDEAGRGNRALDEFVAADLCGRLPFADGSFDLVYANFVVEHLAEPARAFEEWRRVVRPGGSAVLLTSNVANPAVWLAAHAPRRLRAAAKRRGAGAAEHDVIEPAHRANTPSRLEAFLRAARFVPVRVELVGTLHRYVERQPRLARLLEVVEGLLPERRRSTIVARYVAF
jgi:SAM-dependent methyltransferase